MWAHSTKKKSDYSWHFFSGLPERVQAIHYCSPDCKIIDRDFYSPFLALFAFAPMHFELLTSVVPCLGNQGWMLWSSAQNRRANALNSLPLWIFTGVSVSHIKCFASEDREEPCLFHSLMVGTPWVRVTPTIPTLRFCLRKDFLTFSKGQAPSIKWQLEGSLQLPGPAEDPRQGRRQFSSTRLCSRCWLKRQGSDRV